MLYKKLYNKVTGMNVKKQLYFIYFIAIFIPVIVIGSYLVYNTRSMLLDHYKNQCQSDNVRVKSMLLDMTSSIYNQSDAIASDQTLIKLLGKKYTSKKQSEKAIINYDKITTTIAQDPSIHSIRIYSMNPTLKKTDYISDMNGKFKKTDCYEHFKKTSTPFWSAHKITDEFGNTSIELSFHQKIFLPKIRSYAVLVTTISNNQLKNRIENSSLQTVLWVGDQQFFYCSYNDNDQIPPIALKNYDQEKGSSYIGELKYDHQQSIAAISNLSTTYSDDLFHIASINTEGYQYIHKITLTHILIILLVLVMSIIFISIYSIYFSNRVVALREAMHDASCGDYHIIDNFKGEDEISEAFRDLNVMIQDIIEKETTAYEAKIKAQQLVNQQQQMEFKMLTSQINPHFLYNTLETIRMSKYKIMPLLIQPIVENALLHGLEEVEENGRIVIHIQKVQNRLIIDVYDNGCGMTKDELEQMKQNMYDHPKDSSKSIGLANIYQRIQLYYGKEYGLKVDSEKGVGTIFTMTLPAQEYEKGETKR